MLTRDQYLFNSGFVKKFRVKSDVFVKIPAASQPPLTVMLGSLGTIIAQVANYYWGSSKSSSDKNETIAGLMR